jgi:hypothetical protein
MVTEVVANSNTKNGWHAKIVGVCIAEVGHWIAEQKGVVVSGRIDVPRGR